MAAPVNTHPVDVSPFGVSGMGGNVRDWCLDLFRGNARCIGSRVIAPEVQPNMDPSAVRVQRGGLYHAGARYARTASRLRSKPTDRLGSLGFRGLYRPIP